MVSDIVLDKYKNLPEYAASKGGMLNIYRLFILRSISLLKPNGVFCEIFPLAFTGDISASKTRKFIFDNCSIIEIEAFPERDNPAKRVFKTVKMSVCIVMLSKGKKNSPFNVRINREPYVEVNKLPTSMSLQDIIALDNSNLTIPLTDKDTTNLLLKIFRSAKPLSTYAKCMAGEIDMTFCKKAFSRNIQYPPLVRGANIGWFHYKHVISQGENIFIDEDTLSKIKNIDDSLVNNPRIVMQGITGVNEKVRLKMFMIEKAYCSNSTNYLQVTNNDISLLGLLGILNSRLMNFVFSQFSTNSNVNGYEVDNLPIIIPTKSIEPYVSTLKNNYQDILTANNLNRYVYKLYDLSYDEVLIVDPETQISRKEYDNFSL